MREKNPHDSVGLSPGSAGSSPVRPAISRRIRWGILVLAVLGFALWLCLVVATSASFGATRGELLGRPRCAPGDARVLLRATSPPRLARIARLSSCRISGPTRGDTMKLAIELTEQQAQRLREGASRLGVEPEQLALAAVTDLIASEGPDFDAAAQRVLDKNEELYRRLA